jgi:hypothetical protein
LMMMIRATYHKWENQSAKESTNKAFPRFVWREGCKRSIDKFSSKKQATEVSHDIVTDNKRAREEKPNRCIAVLTLCSYFYNNKAFCVTYQKRPLKMFWIMKFDCPTTTNKVINVHVNCPNWYLMVSCLRVKTKTTNPLKKVNE